ncbi:hypothetical protein BJ508DRAFT_177502 [Ascobolus immersus RN42]|uniref:Uncharacterized protein n=1 Tax=Ascobolus immersus RN42 TaxID=1160509 RepID=A0A3N4IN07_ASCIM|nr:hypothetical protein BJ508DRAFT_177502 [Ascobolus immersus RN42]
MEQKKDSHDTIAINRTPKIPVFCTIQQAHDKSKSAGLKEKKKIVLVVVNNHLKTERQTIANKEPEPETKRREEKTRKILKEEISRQKKADASFSLRSSNYAQ